MFIRRLQTDYVVQFYRRNSTDIADYLELYKQQTVAGKESIGQVWTQTPWPFSVNGAGVVAVGRNAPFVNCICAFTQSFGPTPAPAEEGITALYRCAHVVTGPL
jgi:hypothetical protein